MAEQRTPRIARFEVRYNSTPGVAEPVAVDFLTLEGQKVYHLDMDVGALQAMYAASKDSLAALNARGIRAKNNPVKVL